MNTERDEVIALTLHAMVGVVGPEWTAWVLENLKRSRRPFDEVKMAALAGITRINRDGIPPSRN